METQFFALFLVILWYCQIGIYTLTLEEPHSPQLGVLPDFIKHTLLNKVTLDSKVESLNDLQESIAKELLQESKGLETELFARFGEQLTQFESLSVQWNAVSLTAKQSLPVQVVPRENLSKPRDFSLVFYFFILFILHAFYYF